MDFNEYLIASGHIELVSRHKRSPLYSRIAEIRARSGNWRLMCELWKTWKEDQ